MRTARPSAGRIRGAARGQLRRPRALGLFAQVHVACPRNVVKSAMRTRSGRGSRAGRTAAAARSAPAQASRCSEAEVERAAALGLEVRVAQGEERQAVATGRSSGSSMPAPALARSVVASAPATQRARPQGGPRHHPGAVAGVVLDAAARRSQYTRAPRDEPVLEVDAAVRAARAWSNGSGSARAPARPSRARGRRHGEQVRTRPSRALGLVAERDARPVSFWNPAGSAEREGR